MSVSMYQNQVVRLTKDIADAQKRLAEANAKAAKARSEALRIASSVSRTASEPTLRQKQAQVQRLEEAAVGHDRRAAQSADQIANKRRGLASAEESLRRAEARQRAQQEQKDERESRRRHDEELRHIRTLEAARRQAAHPFPTQMTARPHPVMRAAGTPSQQTDHEFDVCLSFAGENRDYVEMVARGLKAEGVSVFYDEDEATTLWGKDLLEHLDWVYRKASRYCVMFISEHYARKQWTRHERRSALARALEDEGEYILPARFDQTELDGLRPTVGYLDLAEVAPATLVEYILKKLRAD